jgi:hypothetical protein
MTSICDHAASTKNGPPICARYATFVEDWDSPEMSVYDNYASAKAKL